MNPRVSLVMPTFNRVRFARTAVHCYLQQMYPLTELIIVDDSDDGIPYPQLPAYADINHIKLNKRTPTGTKRNIGAEAATGEIIANWDDDDYSNPHRIEDEVRRLLFTGKAVTGYNKTVVVDEETGELFRNEGGPPYFASGTSQCYWREWWQKYPFPDCTFGEDSVFSRTARLKDQLAIADPGKMLVARKHANNTEFVNTARLTKLGPEDAPIGLYESLKVTEWYPIHHCSEECHAEAERQFAKPMIEYKVDDLPEVVTR